MAIDVNPNPNHYENAKGAFIAGAAGALGAAAGQAALANPTVGVPVAVTAYLVDQTKDAPVHSARQRVFACVVRIFGRDIAEAPKDGSTLCNLGAFRFTREQTGILKRFGLA